MWNTQKTGDLEVGGVINRWTDMWQLSELGHVGQSRRGWSNLFQGRASQTQQYQPDNSWLPETVLCVKPLASTHEC